MGPRETVLEIVRAHVAEEIVHDATPLGASGLGLDSISIAEVLLECEVRFGLSFSELLDQRAPLTVSQLLSHLETAAPR